MERPPPWSRTYTAGWCVPSDRGRSTELEEAITSVAAGHIDLVPGELLIGGTAFAHTVAGIFPCFPWVSALHRTSLFQLNIIFSLWYWSLAHLGHLGSGRRQWRRRGWNPTVVGRGQAREVGP